MTDVANRNRVQRGVSTGGQFAKEQAVEAAGGTGALGMPAPRNRPIAEWADHAVGAVMDGPLSRGVVNKERRAAFHEERIRAIRYRPDFAEGMQDTLLPLYGHRRDEVPQDGTANHLLTVAGKKRTRAEDREAWRLSLQHVPDRITPESAAEYERGRIAGALYLSGLDHEYDLLPPDPAEPEPHTVSTVEFDGRGFEIDLNDADTQHYTVHEGDTELASFSYGGDPKDHDLLQSEALQALEESGEIERCSEEDCGNSLADCEGWDGKCGDCADRTENDDDSPVCELCGTGLDKDEAALTKPVLMCTDCRDDDDDDLPSVTAQRQPDGSFTYAGKAVVPGETVNVYSAAAGMTEHLVQEPTEAGQ